MPGFKHLPLQIQIFLKFLPNPFVRKWDPLARLGEYQKFIAFGGDQFQIDSVPHSTSEEPAIVLGGYLGISSIHLAKKGYNVVAFEPVEQFAASIENSAKEQQLPVTVVRALASNRDGVETLYLAGDATTIFGANSSAVPAKAIHFSKWLADRGEQVSVLEINIEGGEYVVLEDLIVSGKIAHVKNLIVQFHNFDVGHENKRDHIRKQLLATHDPEYNFPWVWESWIAR